MMNPVDWRGQCGSGLELGKNICVQPVWNRTRLIAEFFDPSGVNSPIRHPPYSMLYLSRLT